MKYALLYLVIVNYIAFSLFHIDKNRAMQSKRRISEKDLLMIAFFGGSPGALAGMQIFRHKTKKRGFRIQLFMILLVQWAIYLFLFRKGI